MKELLEEILEYLRDCEDTDDNSDGTVGPNWAMSMLTQFEDRILAVLR